MFGYFCPFGTFLFFSFRSLLAMYMFSLPLPFMPSKTFVFRVSKNICLSCQEKHFAFSCQVIRVLYSEETLTCSGLTPHMKEAISYLSDQGTFFVLKQYHSLYAQCEREKYSFKLNYSFATCKQISPARLSVKNMIHFAAVFHCFDCEYKCK